MYRRVVLFNSAWINNAFIDVLYRVRGARLLSQYRAAASPYDANIGVANGSLAVVFADSIRLRATAGVGPGHTFEFDLDVSENQPADESIEEISTTGVAIVVFNENGVVICSNGKGIPANSAPAQTVVPGEMTSVPGEEPGEMTSEPIDGTGEMTSEPIDSLNTTI